MERSDILIFDIETDSLDIESAKVKWFGAYSYFDKEYYLLDYTKKQEIQKLLDRHSVLVGFNSNQFDLPILENNNFKISKKNKIDLLSISKIRLPSMKRGCPNYKLKTICNFLNLDEFGKGDIDYNIFKKDKWNKNEIVEIKKYLKQDIILTKKLFDWYDEQFKPLEEFLSTKDRNDLIHIKSSLSSLSYRVICNLSKIKVEWNDKENKSKKQEKISGGHHIESRNKKVKGNIVSVDFVSAYPHAIIMNNIISKTKEWGQVEQSLNKIFLERLEAKRNNDKIKSLAYKIVINSFYGLLGNYSFKSFYNPNKAGEVTKTVRTWLKRLAKTLEENGFYVVYGFTDNVMVKIPSWSSRDQLKIITDKFVEDIKSKVQFPLYTFKLELEREMKFIWFVAKNCYLWVDMENNIGYKSTLLNSNTPKIVMQLFNDYMSPKIVKELDVNFTDEELKNEILKLLEKDISGATEEFNVEDTSKYKVKTSMHYQISERYGQGKHFLIPNTKNVGVGKSKNYCSKNEFDESKLTYLDIDLNGLMKHLKPFYSKQKEIKE
jgi:DNA polymerase elongation subunit (family B)